MKPGPTLQIIGPMPFDQKLISPNLETIIVDGGLNHKLQINAKVTSIGDNDSNTTSTKLNQLLKQDKDHSDLNAALELAKGHKELALYGFLNGRKDHEFANLLEAISFLEEGCQMNFENQIFVSNKEIIELNHQGIFSLFSFTQSRISLSGKLKYQLDCQELRPFSSHGLSNLGLGDFKIKNHDQNVIIIFLN